MAILNWERVSMDERWINIDSTKRTMTDGWTWANNIMTDGYIIDILKQRKNQWTIDTDGWNVEPLPRNQWDFSSPPWPARKSGFAIWDCCGGWPQLVGKLPSVIFQLSMAMLNYPRDCPQGLREKRNVWCHTPDTLSWMLSPRCDSWQC